MTSLHCTSVVPALHICSGDWVVVPACVVVVVVEGIVVVVVVVVEGIVVVVVVEGTDFKRLLELPQRLIDFFSLPDLFQLPKGKFSNLSCLK